MTFDLVAYASDHGYRLRNLHDGGPVPPAWRPTRNRARPTYCGEDDRCDVVPGRRGYVTTEGADRIGWCLLLPTRRALTPRLREIRAAGGVVTQEGAAEAAGWAPADRIADVLAAVGAYRRKSAPATGGARGAEPTRREQVGGRVPVGPN
jgi:hypothetical protein